jgi:hypothetical protein
MVRVLEHQRQIQAARDEAIAILDEDPELSHYEHLALQREMQDRFSDSKLDVVQSG